MPLRVLEVLLSLQLQACIANDADVLYPIDEGFDGAVSGTEQLYAMSHVSFVWEFTFTTLTAVLGACHWTLD